MTPRRVALITEARPATGTGHLEETMALASVFDHLGGFEIEVLIDSGVSDAALARAGSRARRVPLDSHGCRTLAGEMRQRGVEALVVNLRRVEAESLRALAAEGAIVVCVDETGRHLPCHALVNPTWVPVDRSEGDGVLILEGPGYLALDSAYQQRHERARVHSGPLRSLVATFGGSDWSGTSLPLVRALSGWRPDVVKSLVVGPLAGPIATIEAEIARTGDASWRLHTAPTSLSDLLGDADLAVTAGGNTLLECACVGTPAIVVYDAPHEGVAGRAFEARGFGLCLCQSDDMRAEPLREAIARFDDPAVRERHAATGRSLVDGRGAGRIAALVRELLETRATARS